MKKHLLFIVLFTACVFSGLTGQPFIAGPENVNEDRSVVAPLVPAITVDGALDDPGWIIMQPVDIVVTGTPGIDLNEIHFGVVYTAEYLYIGVEVFDSILTPFEMGEIFIDGDNSGGAYGPGDLHLRFAGPFVQVIYPDSIEGIMLGFQVMPLGNGVTAELGILWSELGITPQPGSQIGFDILFSDGDSMGGVDYILAWNGNLQNYTETTNFGTLVFWPEITTTATSVISMAVDGNLDDAGWSIDNAVTNIVYGTPTEDINQVNFGLAYNAESLFIGLDVLDAALTFFEMGEVFIDGDNNNSYYGDHDLHLRFAGPVVIVVYPDTIQGIELGFAVKPLGDGYTAELSIPWSELGITPVENEHIGFDLILSDGDSGIGVDYMMAWNGSLQDYWCTSVFGNMVFGVNSGVKDFIDISEQLSIYPNPASEMIYLKDRDNAFEGDLSLKIADISGRTVYNGALNLNDGDWSGLNIDFLNPGIYFITIGNDKQQLAVKKLVVE
jgi:hypothetical protein